MRSQVRNLLEELFFVQSLYMTRQRRRSSRPTKIEENFKSGGNCPTEIDMEDGGDTNKSIELATKMGIAQPTCKTSQSAMAMITMGGAGGATVNTTSGCSQYNTMINSLGSLRKNITCSVDKKSASMSNEIKQKIKLKLKNITCKGDFNLNASNKIDMKVVQNFTAAEATEMKTKIIDGIKTAFENVQKSKTGWGGVDSGSRNFSGAAKDIRELHQDNDLKEKIVKIGNNIEQSIDKDISNITAGGDCNLNANQHVDLVVTQLFDAVTNKVKELESVRKISTSFKSAQESIAEAFPMPKFGSSGISCCLICICCIISIGFALYQGYKKKMPKAK